MANTVLGGWGRAVSSAPDVVVTAPPNGTPALPNHPRGSIGRGAARSYGDAAQNAGGAVVDMTTRGRIHRLDLQTGRVRVDAGLTLDELLRAIVPHGWSLPVTPGTRMVTVGGAIAADVHGKNHVADGSIRKHLTGFSLLLADGSRRWVTPADHDVFAATLGGMGLTGLVLDAELALRSIATSSVRVRTWTTADLDATLAALDRTDATYRVASLDLMSRRRGLGRAIVDVGEHADRDHLQPSAVRQPLRYDPARPVDVPDVFPSGLLNRMTAQAFTAAWFARAPRRPRTRVVDLTSFFYYLDALGHWNRVYGPRGFVQYQFAIPDGQDWALHRITRLLADARCPTFVVVLKRLGPGAGMLSFPLAGWTLAVDIPAGVAGLSRLLEACDDVVCEAGGRVYLAKDARLRAERMPTMYPELGIWHEVRARLDPDGRWRSDLGRRLGLCPPSDVRSGAAVRRGSQAMSQRRSA
jgi:decaprenylphospho-beta-D-ribofuranose 2-oxidase